MESASAPASCVVGLPFAWGVVPPGPCGGAFGGSSGADMSGRPLHNTSEFFFLLCICKPVPVNSQLILCKTLSTQ